MSTAPQNTTHPPSHPPKPRSVENFRSYFHLPHRGAYNFGRWVKFYASHAEFPKDRGGRYTLWEEVLRGLAGGLKGEVHDPESGNDALGVDGGIREKARQALNKIKKKNENEDNAGVTVNKVVLKGVKAGRDINVNIGVGASIPQPILQQHVQGSKVQPGIDVPPPPYAEGDDNGITPVKAKGKGKDVKPDIVRKRALNTEDDDGVNAGEGNTSVESNTSSDSQVQGTPVHAVQKGSSRKRLRPNQRNQTGEKITSDTATAMNATMSTISENLAVPAITPSPAITPTSTPDSIPPAASHSISGIPTFSTLSQITTTKTKDLPATTHPSTPASTGSLPTTIAANSTPTPSSPDRSRSKSLPPPHVLSTSNPNPTNPLIPTLPNLSFLPHILPNLSILSPLPTTPNLHSLHHYPTNSFPTNPPPQIYHQANLLRESLFSIHTHLTLVRGEIDRVRDAVEGLFSHPALGGGMYEQGIGRASAPGDESTVRDESIVREESTERDETPVGNISNVGGSVRSVTRETKGEREEESPVPGVG